MTMWGLSKHTDLPNFSDFSVKFLSCLFSLFAVDLMAWSFSSGCRTSPQHQEAVDPHPLSAFGLDGVGVAAC